MTIVDANISPAGAAGGMEGDGRRFAYAPGFFMVVLGLIFFGACGLGMARAAATNDRGLVIDAIIHLSPENACTFYLVLAGASFAFVLALLFYILPQNFIPRFIILHSNAITLPGAAFDRSHYKVAPGEITHFKLTVVKNRRFLKIYISDRTFPVNPMWLSEPDAFAEIVNWLHAHVPRQAF